MKGHCGWGRLQQVSGCNHLVLVLDDSGTDGIESIDCRGRKVTGAIRSLLNARGLHEGPLGSVLMFGSETVVWREMERYRVGTLQMDNLRTL